MKQNIQRFALGSVLTLLAVQFSGCSAPQGIEPSKAASNQFLQQMQSGQPDVAYSALSTGFKAVAGVKEVKEDWNFLVKNAGKVQSWSMDGWKAKSGTNGDSILLDYDLKCAKSPVKATFDCVEENGKWVIQNVRYEG